MRGGDEKLLETVRGHEPRGYELVIDAARALTSAVQLAKNGGALLIFGVCPKGEKMEISPFDVYSRDLTILGSFSIRGTFHAALKMIEGGQLELAPLLGERYSLEDLPRALEVMAMGGTDRKLVVMP